MKIFALGVIISACASAAGATGPNAPISPAPASVRHPAPYHFEKTPLGNVVRAIGARLGASISITANATAPITGDFSKLDPAACLAEAARQAGLVVIALGKNPQDGFSLVTPEAAAKARKAAAPADPAPSQAALAEAAKRREALLRRQAELLAEEAKLGQ